MQPAVIFSATFTCAFTLLAAAAASFLVLCQLEKGDEFLGGVVKLPQSIAIDSSSERMFVVDATDRRILSSKLDGTNVFELSWSNFRPHSVAVDAGQNKIYWTDVDAGKVTRSSYDGLTVEDIAVNLDQPAGIAVQPAGSGGSTAQVVWVSRTAIQTASVPLSLGTLPPVSDISAVDPLDGAFGAATDSNYVYWTSSAAGRIQRKRLDGSGTVRTVVEGEGLVGPQNVVVNDAEDMMYWTDPSAGKIGRASLGMSTLGTNKEFVVVTSEEPRGLALDADTSLYFGDSSAQVVRRSGINGECMLYTALEDEMIALIILGSALGIAVIGCCAVVGYFVRSRRAAKSSPPASDTKAKDAIVPTNVADSAATKVAAGDDAHKAAHNEETYDEDAYPPKPIPPSGEVHDSFAINSGAESRVEKDFVEDPPLTDERGAEHKNFETEAVTEPEIDMPNRNGKCCLFCSAG